MEFLCWLGINNEHWQIWLLTSSRIGSQQDEFGWGFCEGIESNKNVKKTDKIKSTDDKTIESV